MKLLSVRSARDDEDDSGGYVAVVSALYAEHALGLTRLAQVMLGDRAAAEDVVQDAFAGLCRRWGYLTDAGKAQAYLRSSVLNGCRSVLRRQARVPVVTVLSPDVLSADAPLLASEDRRAACWRRCGGCRTGSARCWCSATTWSFPTRRSRGPWGSARAPSGPPHTGA
jgi:Sigma-70 region 2